MIDLISSTTEQIYDATVPLISKLLNKSSSWIHTQCSYNGKTLKKDGWLQNDHLMEIWFGSKMEPADEDRLYSDELFVLASLNSYLFWSREYLHRLERFLPILNEHTNGLLDSIETIVDFGGGIGLSSLHLHQLFQKLGYKANIVYQNKQSHQSELAKMICEETDVEINVGNLVTADAYFMSEVLEHFKKPVKFMYDLVELTNGPKLVMHASSFTQPNFPGHFPEYDRSLNDKPVLTKNKSINRYMNKVLYDNDYVNVEHVSLWNHRPQVFVKRSALRVPDDYTSNRVSLDPRWIAPWLKND